MSNEVIEGFRLSPQQTRLWRLAGGSGTGRLLAFCLARITGRIDAEVLRTAIEGVVARHEILRTSFELLPGMPAPLQVIADRAGFGFERRDLRGAAPGERAEALAAIVAEAEETVFDPARGPLLRASLVSLADDDHRLILCAPALCADAVSLGALLREIAGLCDPAARLPEPAQHVDLSEWQNDLLESAETASGRARWQGAGPGDPSAAQLPFRRPGPGAPELSPARAALSLDGGETAALVELGHRLAVSPPALALAAWTAQMGRLTGEEEVVVGAAFDGRKYQEVARAIGPFSRLVPVRARLGSGVTFAGLARQVAEALREGEAWQEYFQLEETAFFPLAFEHDPGFAPVEAGGLRFEIECRRAALDRCELKLEVAWAGESLSLGLTYAPDPYGDEEARVLLGQLRALLAAVPARPDAPLEDLSLLSGEERRRLLVELNDTRRPWSGPDTLDKLFQAQAGRTPRGVALRAGGETLTYAELARRANQLARHLRRLGVEPETRVAICLDRSPDLIVALLGVLGAGGAWVPLDPAQPRERLASLLAESRPALVVTLEALASRVEESGVPLLLLDRDAAAIAAESPEAPESGAGPGSLAYVLYTSGSTGRPKGVMVSHEAIVNRLLWMADAFAIQEGDRVAHKTPFAFDACIWEIFVPLFRGAECVLAEPGAHQDPDLLARMVAGREVTVLQLVPSLLEAVLASPAFRDCAALRRVFCGGEVLPAALRDRFFSLSQAELHNLYGPTEVAIDATHWACSRSDRRPFVPIGRPLSNVEVYVLDGGLSPLATGETGDLYVGGAGLARGYLGRPDLTAERFLPHPWSGQPGARLYRTGDRARFLADGALEFLGRADQQIKLRGFRIEPGEIEVVLASHPAVLHAVVVAREAPGGLQLVAYAVPAAGAAPRGPELRAFLAEKLPEYMVPAVVMVLAELPRTASGKVDRRALPRPETGVLETGLAPVSPRNLVEEMLAEIWRDLLQVERLGVDDNFFTLGGHSLLATQLVSRVRDGFRREISLRNVFERPTIAGLARALAAPAAAGSAVSEWPPIVPVPRGGELPLSFGQQRLWFIDQLEPGSPAYNIFTAVRLDGELSARTLAAALDQVVARHEVLRTTFPAVDGKPYQLIAPAAPLPLPVIDLGGLPEARREPEALRLAEEESAHSFSLARGPLVRALLLRLSPRVCFACVNLHHSVSDGWSTSLLIQEVAALYGAFSESRPSPLPDLPVQYADFAVWQRRCLRGEALERELAFWREQLAGAPEVLKLPVDRPRASRASHHGEVRTRRLSPELAADAVAFSRRSDATAFMTLLAVWQLQLHLYSGQRDVLVGTPIANRTRTETESLIGFFVNTLVMRAGLSADLTFAELLGQVRERALEAHAHQDLPLERLVDDLGVERQLGVTPLFQVLFALQNLPDQRIELPGLSLAPLDVRKGVAKFDLTLAVSGDAGGFTAALEHRAALFDGTTAERILQHLEAVLAAAVADPWRRIGDFSLATAAERHQILWEWNPPALAWRGLPSLPEAFEEQARRAPERTALTAGDGDLTYGELNRRANRLARHLAGLGVGPEVPVALCLERSGEAVVAILAVLKAGGCYVPLDPALPAERLRFILEDTGAPVVLTRSGMADPFAGSPAHVVLLDREAAGIAALADGDLPVEVSPEHPAYVIYTSGSTGRPKGVVVTHANVLPLFASTHADFGFDADDVWTLFHSYAFDFSVWEIWGALLYGGRLVVVPYLTSRSPEELYDLLAREKVTVLNQTPSAFRQLIRAEEERGGGADALALRFVIFGGEALDPMALRPWYERHGDERPLLVNMYGITETTVHVTYRPLCWDDLAAGSMIGGAIPSLRLYLLAGGNVAPAGVPGEIHIGGAGLARGYLGRPDLTAERFVPDPFSQEAGARLYRSGDLARYRPDGGLEYLGRGDAQVKVRGFRIELGEIETAMASHPGVREVAVVVREDQPGDRRLVAYFVPGGEEPATAAALQELARRRLPDYMVPAAWVPLEALPLTANRKLDRRAMPAPAALQGEPAELAVLQTAEEETLAGIWSKVLGVRDVGRHDNFFALGGDSILSLQVIALARGRGLEISLQTLFQNQTLAELARSARQAGGVAASLRIATAPFSLVRAEDLPGLPAGSEDAYPLTLLQAGMLFHMELAPQEPPYHNVDSAHLRAPFDPDAFRAAVQRTVARHPVLRTSFHLSGFNEPLQVVHREAVLPVPVEDLRHLPAEEQERVIGKLMRSEKRRLFDLTRPPQIRFFVHLRSEDTFQLTFTENHAILDGWSLHSTLAEIFRTYLALLAGEEPAAEPQPSFSFRDYVAMERAALESSEHAAWWERRLADSTVTRMPRWAGPPPQPRGPRLRVLSVDVAPEVSEGLKRLARGAAIPLKSALLAAHLKALSLLSGQTDVVTGLTTHGRPEDADAERTRGLFLNTLPFRFRLAAGESWAGLGEAVLAAEREMLAHRGYPAAALQKRLGGQPLFEIAFNYVHFHVVEDLVRSGPVEVLSFQRAEGTNFGLLAGFSQNLVSSRVTLQLEYDAAEIRGAQVEALGGLYARVLAAMAADPERCHDMPLLSAAERQAVVLEWNDTRWSGGGAGCLHELIREQAERDPDAVALVFNGRTCSYGALDHRANALAHRLRGLGVAPGSVVAILAERSLELMVGLLGILKAGGAYLPLEPAYPEARLAFMLEQAGPPVVLAQRRLAGLLPAGGPTVLVLDPPESEEPAESAAGPVTCVTPADLAYVIYTSGSTGQPKGVMNSHAGIVNRLEWMQSAYGLTPEDRVLQKTPYSFDVSVWELFWPLLTGARLVLAPPELHRDSAGLVRLIAEEGVTTLHFVPSMLHVFLDEPELARCGALRRVICSGEALPFELRQRFLSRLERAELHNLYGPTEAAVDVTAWDCRRETVAAVVPIGRPISNLRIHLLDGYGDPVPPGTPGELYIGGVGVARGYLAAPRLTAERFVPDPFTATPGGRLYRTGDLARSLPDGAVEFLGRLDHQVKIRGQRIELGELEAALLAHPEVREAVAVLDGGGGQGRLVAYIVGTAGEAPPATELREFLRQRLPEPMIPARFVSLGGMPLNPNGKLDRKALPSPDDQRADLARLYVEPRDEAERQLAAIWSEVVHVERVGIDDNFFELGGDSIRSIQVVARARAAGMRLSLQLLLQHGTVRELARHVEWQASSVEAVPLTAPFSLVPEADREKLPPDVEDAYPLAALQSGMLFHSALDPGSAVYHDVVSYHLAVTLDEAAVREALAGIMERHAVLRTSFDLVSYTEPLQLVHRAVEPPLEITNVSALSQAGQDAAVAAWIEEEKARPFEWRRAPLFRVHVHRRGADQLQLSFSFHHAILDGWSLASLLTELFQLYLSLISRAEPVTVPPAAITFRDFVAMERAALLSAEPRSFWESRLAGFTFLQLPRWRTPRAAGGRIATLPVAIPMAVSQGLRGFAASSAVPVKSVLLAAHLRVLGLVSGFEDVVTGLVLNGRPEALGAEQVKGLFLNTLPFRSSIGGVWADWVREVFQEEMEMIPWRRFPLAELQRTFGAGRPLFETAFDFTHFHVLEEVRDVEGLEVLGSAGFEQTNFTLMAGFSINLASSGIELQLTYDANQLSGAQVRSLAGYYSRVLQRMASDPRSSVSGPYLAPQEQHQLVREWNDTRRGETGLTLPELFEAQVRRDPAAIALLRAAETVSYGDLDARANRLARELLARGVGPEVPVAVCCERGIGLIVALLAVLKAGGGYLPLDPVYPEERLSFMLGDAGCPVLVTEERLLPRLPEGSCSVLCLDRDEQRIERQSARPLQPLALPESLGYLMYTSGTSGCPKGVMISHQAAGWYGAVAASGYDIQPGDRLLQFSSISFDISVEEIFSSLSGGATLVLPASPEVPAPRLLFDECAAAGVTVLSLPTAYWHELALEVSAHPEAFPDSLRLVCLGGEKVVAERVARWREITAGRSELVNTYGPTEATVVATLYRIPEEWSPFAEVPLGQPISGARTYVLNDAGDVLPMGAPGELWIGGAGVARGYLGRPDLTAERFVPDPFGRPGGRLYRTGDLARWRHDGSLEFLGRLDHQVKVRGFRIELGEIESVLALHPQVSAAMVVAWEHVPGDKRLVAYVVPAAGEEPSHSALREHLRGQLPDYMLPAAFTLLEEIPLTPNGKVDRRALPVPEVDRSALAVEYLAPRTPTEEVVTSILLEILRVERVGVWDSFFELGGHSLLATRVAARLSDAFQVEFPLRDLFEYPNAEALADRLSLQLGGREIADEIAAMYLQVQQLSEDEVQELLSE